MFQTLPVASLAPSTSVSCFSHSGLIYTYSTVFSSLRFPSHTPRKNTLILLILLHTFVAISPSTTWTSTGAVGNWTVNLNVPCPGHTNSWFSLSRTFRRTEILKKCSRQAIFIHRITPWFPQASSPSVNGLVGFPREDLGGEKRQV